jgi:hypothetical protein
MADLPSFPGTPRWPYVLGTIAIIVLALLFVVRHLTMGGHAGQMQ